MANTYDVLGMYSVQGSQPSSGGASTSAVVGARGPAENVMELTYLLQGYRRGWRGCPGVWSKYKREGGHFEVSRILRASDISLTEGVLPGSFTPGFAGGYETGY